MSKCTYTYDFKIFAGIVQSKPYYQTFSTYSMEKAYAMAVNCLIMNFYSEIIVKNTIHLCRYTAGDFCKRYESGQRNFVKSNHPSFERWRPKRIKGGKNNE